MAHGRKRILGGKMLVVVGVVLAGVMVMTGWRKVWYSGTHLTVGLVSGEVRVWFFESTSPVLNGIPHWTWHENSDALQWWLNRSRFDLNTGVAVGFAGRNSDGKLVLFCQVLLWPPAVLAVAAGAASWRLGFVARRRWKNAHKACPVCGYVRAGLAESAPCPECGRAAGAINTLAAARGS